MGILLQVGRNILFCRKQMGWTQTELSRRIGVTPQAISKWEHGNSCPDIALLPTLAALLGVTVDALLSDEMPVERVAHADRK